MRQVHCRLYPVDSRQCFPFLSPPPPILTIRFPFLYICWRSTTVTFLRNGAETPGLLPVERLRAGCAAPAPRTRGASRARRWPPLSNAAACGRDAASIAAAQALCISKFTINSSSSFFDGVHFVLSICCWEEGGGGRRLDCTLGAIGSEQWRPPRCCGTPGSSLRRCSTSLC